jgi:hypothetical protein
MTLNSRIVASLDRKRLGHSFGAKQNLDPRRFDKETRRKPLVFAADAVSYGIGTAVWGVAGL